MLGQLPEKLIQETLLLAYQDCYNIALNAHGSPAGVRGDIMNIIFVRIKEIKERLKEYDSKSQN